MALGISTAIAVYKSYSRASKSSPTCTPFHAGLRTAKNAKRVAKEIDRDEKLVEIETAEHETRVKGNDTGCARWLRMRADMGRRIIRIGGFEVFINGRERMTSDV